MKGLLIGFFQVLCFLQVFGANQLNSHLSDQTKSAYFSHHPHSEHTHLVVKHHESRSFIHSDSSIPLEDPEVIFETLEEETEDLSSGKQLLNNLFFSGVPVDQSLDYLYGNTKNSALACEQLSFIKANKRHIVFQVFRI